MTVCGTTARAAAVPRLPAWRTGHELRAPVVRVVALGGELFAVGAVPIGERLARFQRLSIRDEAGTAIDLDELAARVRTALGPMTVAELRDRLAHALLEVALADERARIVAHRTQPAARVADAGPAIGEAHGSARLTVDDVHEIRALAAQGWTDTRIASRFAVSRSLVSQIVRRARWSHVV